MRDRRLQRFLNETRSATAVEFAMIGSVLFLFLMGIIVMGVVQFWQLTLDDSVRSATRQLQINPTTLTDGQTFISKVCANEFSSAITNCGTATLQYAVQGSSTFSQIAPATLSAAGVLSKGSTFSGVTASFPVLVQVAYKVPFNIPLLPWSMLTYTGTPSIISAVAAVEEP